MMPLSQSCLFEANGYVVQAPALCQKRKLGFDDHRTLDDHDMDDGRGDTQLWEDYSSAPKRQCLWSCNDSQRQSVSPPLHYEESLPGCHKDVASSYHHTAFTPTPLQVIPESYSVPPPLSPSSSQQNQASSSNSLANIFISRLHQRQREEEEKQRKAMFNASGHTEQCSVGMNGDSLKERNNNTFNDDQMESYMSMDSDYVPDVSQYTPAASTGTTSSSTNSTTPQNIVGPGDRRCGFNSCNGLRPSPVTGRLHCLCSASWRGMYGMDAAYMTDYY